MTPQMHAELTADGTTIVMVPDADAVIACLPVLKTATPLFKPSKPPGAILLPVTWAAVVQLAGILGPAWCPGPRLTGWVAHALTERSPTHPRAALSVPPPAGRVPRPYQVEGALMIGTIGRVLLFDDPGTGKTITAILGLVERAEVATVDPVVCVVPGSVVDSWINEWRAWAPDWRVVAWRGSPASRAALAGTADVYVAGYDTARNDAADARGPLVMLNAATVIADECHFLKTPTAQRSLAVRRLARHAANFIALSGTPITHHPGDLWPALEGLEPLAYPSRTRFVDRYCDQIRGDYETRIVGLNRFTEPEFRLSLLGQHRRVAKADVLTQLPPKIYSVRHVEIPPAWRQTYDDMEETMFAELPDGGGELSVMNVLTQLTVLSRLASSAADVEITTEIDPETDLEKRHIHLILKAPCWKAAALVEILTERSGSPVVTFSPSRQLTVLVGAAAEKAGFSVGYVVGGQKPADRTDTIDAFQAGKFDLLAATTGVGGTGLTLTAAGTVVFTQRPWSLVEALQAEDRCHRIGSEIHDVIEVIDIVATNTVETRVREVLRSKAGQLAALLQDPRIAAQVLGGTRLGKGNK